MRIAFISAVLIETWDKLASAKKNKAKDWSDNAAHQRNVTLLRNRKMTNLEFLSYRFIMDFFLGSGQDEWSALVLLSFALCQYWGVFCSWAILLSTVVAAASFLLFPSFIRLEQLGEQTAWRQLVPRWLRISLTAAVYCQNKKSRSMTQFMAGFAQPPCVMGKAYSIVKRIEVAAYHWVVATRIFTRWR